ncbi:HalOD1 output domain-containing protein [Halomontanus rarus]|uniref:HalOD1 output domain-containing protein n=1 Tax=Halomontanus rarus TaxID=3034020 RepID=UPI001A9A108F
MLLSVDRTSETGTQSLSFEIIAAIAEREGVDTTEIEPPEYEALYDVLNPEALDALFAPCQDGTQRSTGRVKFSYCGYDVVVTSDGDVHIDD